MCPHQSCTDGACTSDNGPNDVLHPFLHAVSVGLSSCPFVQAISSEKPYFVNTLRKRGEKLHNSTSPAFGEGNAISIPRPARANLTRKPCPKVIKNGAPCQRLTPTCRTGCCPICRSLRISGPNFSATSSVNLLSTHSNGMLRRKMDSYSKMSPRPGIGVRTKTSESTVDATWSNRMTT